MVSIREYGRRYIWGLQEKEQVSHIQRSFKNANRLQRDYTNSVSLKQLRKVVLREPMLLKAIKKKNKDVVRNWFTVKTVKSDGKVPVAVLKLIDDFNKRTRFPYILNQSCDSSNIYGTGFFERTYATRSNKLDSPVPHNAKPLGLVMMDSERIVEICKHPVKKDDEFYFRYSGNVGEPDVYIHPDRLEPVIIDKLPFSKFGISKVDVLYNILKSKMNADVSSGEIINWHGHGILDLTITNMDDEQEREAIKLMDDHPDFYVSNEDYELKVHNPTQIDPEPFYNYFYTNIAAGMEMPTHMLTGFQTEGNEVGVSDYYHDVENIQKIILTPIIVKIYKQLLSAHGYSWKYEIDWNPIFVDELSEAKILQTRTFSAVQNTNAKIISPKEARGMLNEGSVALDVDKVPKQDAPAIPGKPTGTEPNIAPQPTVKPKGDDKTINMPVKIYEITPEQEKMLLSQMKADGVREMALQDLRIEEAKNGKKVKRGKNKNTKKTKA